MVKEKLVIVGEYNEYGYTVSSTEGDVFHEAGNHRLDSGPNQSVQPDSRWAVPLRTLRSWCIRDARETVKLHKAIYGGVERKDVSAVS